jgi:hypothetical protein
MNRIKCLARSAFSILGLLLVLDAGAAHAQWGVTSVGLVEYDTNETLLLLADVSAAPGRMGIVPVVGVQAFNVSYPGVQNRVNAFSVRPSAGLRSNFVGGLAEARVGYAFQSEERVAPGTIVPDTREGTVLSGQLTYWGTGGPIGAQAIASYNIPGESIWTRGRLTTRLADMGDGAQVRLGGEVAFQRQPGVTTTQPGGLVEWHTGGGLIIGAGAGVKLNENADNATYFRAEIVLPIVR